MHYSAATAAQGLATGRWALGTSPNPAALRRGQQEGWWQKEVKHAQALQKRDPKAGTEPDPIHSAVLHRLQPSSSEQSCCSCVSSHCRAASFTNVCWIWIWKQSKSVLGGLITPICLARFLFCLFVFIQGDWAPIFPWIRSYSSTGTVNAPNLEKSMNNVSCFGGKGDATSHQ